MKAPRSLSFEGDHSTALEYAERVRAAALGPGKGAYVDLSDCRRMSPIVCLVLGAEMERCRGLKHDSIHGCDPKDKRVAMLLRAMGFHRCLGIGGRRRSMVDQILEIRSGGADADVAKALEGVAAVATKAMGNQRLANRVHGALNEAMLNVRMHAYDLEFFEPATALAGHWWVAGISDPDHGEVIFFAYDHGVGIARTAPKTMGQELTVILDRLMAALGLGRADASDHHVIEAAIAARKTRTGLPQHGKGLASMIKLVDLAGSGYVLIASGGGQYIYERKGPDGSETMERSAPMAYRVPGTLVVWRLKALRQPEDV